MKLIKLEATNLATYDNINIDFTKLQYPTFVEGRTGAGKTTLFVDAITAALYGAAYGHKRLLREIVMKGKTSARIALTFEVNDKIYRAERIIYSSMGQPGALRIYEIDPNTNTKKLLTYSTRESERYIERIIGLTYEALTASTIVRQGDVYGFLDAKPAERRDLIIDILRLGIFERLKERAKVLKNAKEQEKKMLEGEIAQLQTWVKELPAKERELQTLKNELPSIINQINELDREIENLENKLNNLREKDLELMKLIGELEAKKVEFNETKKREKAIEEELRTLEEELKLIPRTALEELDELSESVYRAETIMREIEITEKAIKEIKDYIRDKEQVEHFNKMREHIKIKLESLEKQISDLDQLIEEKTKYETLLRETQKHLDALKKGIGKCPVCGRPLTKELKEKRERELNNELEKIKERIKGLDTTIKEKKELKKSIENLKQKFIALKAKAEQKQQDLRLKKIREENLEVKEEERVKLRNDYNKIIQKLNNLLYTTDLKEAKEKIRKLKETKNRIEKSKILREELENIKEKRRKLEEEIENYKVYEEERSRLKETIETTEQKLREKREQLRQISRKKTEIESKITHLETETENLRKKRDELEEKKKKIIELEEDIKALGILANKVFAPSELPTKLLEDYLKVIEELTNQYLEAFGQDIRIRFKLERRGEKTQIQIKTYHRAYERDPNTFSGGEKTLIGFSLRLAIGKLISRIQTTNVKPKFLIIDEGFGPLDEELRIKVADALTTLLEMGEYEQIIVISHHRELRESPMFKTIIKIEKKNGKSTIEIE